MAQFDEELEDYKFSIETALAGFLANKPADELSDNEIEAAQDIVSNLELSSYMSLTDALDRDDAATIEQILSNVNISRPEMGESIKHIRESNYLDSDILLDEGFTYFGIFENELIRNKVITFLDENNIEYMCDTAGHVQMKFADREHAYRAEAKIANIIAKNNSSYVRDDVQIDEKRKPFPDPGKKYRRFGKPKGLTGGSHHLRKLQKKNGGQGCFTEGSERYNPTSFSKSLNQIVERKIHLKKLISYYENKKEAGKFSDLDDWKLQHCYSELKENLNATLNEELNLPDLDNVIKSEYLHNLIDNVVINPKNTYHCAEITINQEFDDSFNGYTVIVNKTVFSGDELEYKRDYLNQKYLNRRLFIAVVAFDTIEELKDFVFKIKLTFDKSVDSKTGYEYQIIEEGISKRYSPRLFSRTIQEVVERKEQLKKLVSVYENRKNTGSINKRDAILLNLCYAELKEGINAQLQEEFDLPDLDQIIKTEYNSNIIDNVDVINDQYWVSMLE
ncbi:MAG: hypothetical protein HC836_31805 [Richelia sp. RM2_1_2]|nr:hypothetical protein [Richelia sp. RM2_1_2]